MSGCGRHVIGSARENLAGFLFAPASGWLDTCSEGFPVRNIWKVLQILDLSKPTSRRGIDGGRCGRCGRPEAATEFGVLEYSVPRSDSAQDEHLWRGDDLERRSSPDPHGPCLRSGDGLHWSYWFTRDEHLWEMPRDLRDRGGGGVRSV